jgi:hypothetical protein
MRTHEASVHRWQRAMLLLREIGESELRAQGKDRMLADEGLNATSHLQRQAR